MMAHYPDVFIMTFSIRIPNFALLSQSAQLLLNFCYAAALTLTLFGEFCSVIHLIYIYIYISNLGSTAYYSFNKATGYATVWRRCRSDTFSRYSSSFETTISHWQHLKQTPSQTEDVSAFESVSHCGSSGADPGGVIGVR